MIKKIYFWALLFETLALFFLINGIQRLYLASQGEKLNALMKNDFEEYYSLTSLPISDFFLRRGYWTFIGFLIGILLIGIINWKSKISIMNTILTFLIVFFLFPTGVFMEGIINDCLNNFCGIFGISYSFSFLIGGSIFTIFGLLTLWKTIYATKNTMHNNV